MPELRLFSKNGEPLALSRDAHRRFIGQYMVIADAEKPAREAFLAKRGLGRSGRWIFPGDRDGAKRELVKMLDELYGMGAISEGRYIDLKEGPDWPGIVEAAEAVECWVRALAESDGEIRAAQGARLDPDRHGLVWTLPGECTESHEDDLSAILSEISACETGQAVYYAISAGKVKAMWQGAWQFIDGPWKLGEGIEKRIIGRDMVGLTEKAIQARIAWVKARSRQ